MFKDNINNMLDKQTVQSINSLVTFILDNDKNSNDFKSQLANQLLKALLKQLINLVSTLKDSKALQAFVHFYRDVQVWKA